MAAAQAAAEAALATSEAKSEATTDVAASMIEVAAEAVAANMGDAAAETKAIATQKERVPAKKTQASSKINHPKPIAQPGPTPPVQPTTGTIDTRADKMGKGKVPAVLPDTAGPNYQTPYEDQ